MAMGVAEQAPGRLREGAAPGGHRANGDAGAAMRDLEGMLRRMERTGMADPALLARIADLRRMADDSKSMWEAARSGPWFFICQVAFNLGLVLGKMERGVMAERDGSSRPGIASGSLSMMPVMRRAMGIVQSDGSDPGLECDALGAAWDLMSQSKDVGLGTSIEELDKMTDWDEWSRVMPAVLKRLGL